MHRPIFCCISWFYWITKQRYIIGLSQDGAVSHVGSERVNTLYAKNKTDINDQYQKCI